MHYPKDPGFHQQYVTHHIQQSIYRNNKHPSIKQQNSFVGVQQAVTQQMKNSRASVRITSMKIEHRYIRDQNGDIKSIVLDNGSGIMKVGMAGEDKPRSVFPQIIEQNEKDYKIGDDAFSLCDNMNLHYPIERGNVNNWEEMEKIWNYTFSNILHVNSYEFPILISEPVLNPETNREKMTEIMFEKYQIPALYYENS
ncbi:MAG: putative Beta-actin protein 2, partial [Streblomastix strix]